MGGLTRYCWLRKQMGNTTSEHSPSTCPRDHPVTQAESISSPEITELAESAELICRSEESKGATASYLPSFFSQSF